MRCVPQSTRRSSGQGDKVVDSLSLELLMSDLVGAADTVSRAAMQVMAAVMKWCTPSIAMGI